MGYHHTKTKGDLGVVHAELDLIEKGFLILYPRTEHAPFDLVAYDGNRFIRVQVKYRAAVNGCLHIRFATFWNDRHGTHMRPMPKDEVDVLCVYCPETKRCYYLDPQHFQTHAALRIDAPRNNQTEGIHFAQEFVDLPKSIRGVAVLAKTG